MKPNIIIIMADQLRFDFVGAYTPNINCLINDSISFEHSYCASPLCVPSRGAFFTGTYPTSNGCLINPWEIEDEKNGRLKKGIKTFYEIFENDWDLWHVGKQHLLSFQELDERASNKVHWLKLEGRYKKELDSKNIPPPGGKEYRQFCPEIKNGKFTKIRSYTVPTTGIYQHELKYYYDGFILNDSFNAIDQRNKEKPFCLSAMFLAPHPPFQIPEPYYSMYKDVSLPENVGRWYCGQSPLQMYQLTGFFGTRYSRDEWQEIWRVYAGLVTLFDDCVGKLVAKLKQENLYDDSIIVFTSDHGEMLGSHGLWQKMCLYEESLRVPLSIKLPNNDKAGLKINNAVSHIDVLPTILEAVNYPQQLKMQGNSLMRYCQEQILSDAVYAQFDGNGALGTYQRCIIKDQYKFMFDSIHNEMFFELYDLKNDKQELNNIIFSNEILARKLGQELCDHLSRLNDPIQFSWKYFDQWFNAQKNNATTTFYELP